MARFMFSHCAFLSKCSVANRTPVRTFASMPEQMGNQLTLLKESPLTIITNFKVDLWYECDDEHTNRLYFQTFYHRYRNPVAFLAYVFSQYELKMPCDQRM